MKSILLLFLISLFSFTKAQSTTFTITDEGLTKYVVTEIPGISKEIAYKKVVDWVNRKFNTPQKVIKGMIENEYIRIEGISESAMRYPALGGHIYSPIKYEIEISLKDNKYKFEILSLQEKNYMYPQFAKYEYMDMDLAKSNGTGGYNPVRKANGEFRNRYKYVSDIPDYFNYLNTKLKEYLTGSDKSEDNW